jgi:hypothetical protein
MTKAIRYIGAILCVLCVAQFSTPAQAQTYVRHYTVHISATAGTTVVTASTAYVASVVVAISTVGTNPIQITDTAGNVKFQAASTALGTIISSGYTKDASLQFTGLKIVAPATAVFDVSITYYL